jgi:glycosyltransferase involved in cell wall biosynthesis
MPAFHILHLLHTAEVEGTGIARLVATLAERLDPERYRMHAWFRQGPGPLMPMLERRAVAVRDIEWRRGVRNPAGLWRFSRAVRGHHFALVHQHGGGRSERWIARHVGRAHVLTHLHGRVSEERWEAPLRPNVGGADLVVATSAAVARWAGVNAEVVFPGVDVRPRAPESDGARKHGDHVLGTAGRLVPIKGLEYLLRSLPMVRASVPKLELEIAGSGPAEASLREEARRQGLDGCVRFLGWQDEIPFHRWSVFVVPSLEEAFGMAALEAMAAGLPVVASAVGGLPELVEHGRTGWLVPPADPRALAARLETMLADARQPEEMGAAAQRRAGEFSAERMCAAIEALYERLLIPTSRPNPRRSA